MNYFFGAVAALVLGMARTVARAEDAPVNCSQKPATCLIEKKDPVERYGFGYSSYATFMTSLYGISQGNGEVPSPVDMALQALAEMKKSGATPQELADANFNIHKGLCTELVNELRMLSLFFSNDTPPAPYKKLGAVINAESNVKSLNPFYFYCDSEPVIGKFSKKDKRKGKSLETLSDFIAETKREQMHFLVDAMEAIQEADQK